MPNYLQNNRIEIIFTDLDGTLLNSEKTISPVNLECLQKLGRQNITRVIATGRSLYSFQKLFKCTLPMDYLIFSTGAGVLNLLSDELLHSSSLTRREIQHITSYLIECNADFMVHHAVPHNHHFTFFNSGNVNPDFRKRIELYHNYANKFTTLDDLPSTSAQIIAIFPNDLIRFNEVKAGLSDYQLTRTTSPLDGISTWLEIFPKSVSKGSGAEWLCNHLQVDYSSTLGIGNDYNDLSLLHFTKHSFVVANAPLELKKAFQITRSNNEDGFYHAANQVMIDNSL